MSGDEQFRRQEKQGGFSYPEGCSLVQQTVDSL